MKGRVFGLAVATAAAFAIALPASPAKAVGIFGTFSIAGANMVNYAADTITFSAAVPETEVATGDFLATLGAVIVTTMQNEGAATSYLSLDTNASGPAACGIGCVYSATGAGAVTTFVINAGYTITEITGVALTIIGTGIATLTGFNPTPATFVLTTQGPGGASTFSATTVAVPGPVIGAGLPGLLLAFGGLVAWSRRRREQTA
jgi:hypothetical protein